MRKIPAFRMCSESFIRAVVTRLSPQVCLPGDFILRQGDKASSMFFGQCPLPLYACVCGAMTCASLAWGVRDTGLVPVVVCVWVCVCQWV